MACIGLLNFMLLFFINFPTTDKTAVISSADVDNVQNKRSMCTIISQIMFVLSCTIATVYLQFIKYIFKKIFLKFYYHQNI